MPNTILTHTRLTIYENKCNTNLLEFAINLIKLTNYQMNEITNHKREP